jgi:hypothetical protein
LHFADLSALAKFGVPVENYGDLDYTRTQEIGDAAAFLGFDGIIAPSARWLCNNLIIFSDRFSPDEFTVLGSEPVDWTAWREERRRLRSEKP